MSDIRDTTDRFGNRISIERDTVIEWADVKRQFVSCVRDGARWNQPQGERLARLHADPARSDRWEGGSGAFTLGVLENGFHSPAFTANPARIPQAQKRRGKWNPHAGRPSGFKLQVGDPNFRKRRVRQSRKPSIRVKVQAAWSGAVNVQDIAAYGACVAGLLRSLEQQGFDLTVDLWICLDRLFSDRTGSGQRENVYVRVKRSGQRADFTEWSGVFGPTGYRHLIFTAKCVAADKLGLRATSSLGGCIRSAYGITYDRAAGEIEITCSQNGSFDADSFRQQAKDAGLI